MTLTRASGQLHVRVEIEPHDLARLPPYAQPIVTGGRCYVPLDPRRARSPLGFLPRTARTGSAPALARLLPGQRARPSA